MLNDADFSQFKHVYTFVGKTDLRKGIDGLATLVKQKFSLDPFQPGNLFLFCGSSNHKMKGLVWEDGFLLMTGYSIDPSVRKVRPRHPL